MKIFWWRKDTKTEEEIEVPLVVYNPYRNLLRDNGPEAFGRYFKSEMDFTVHGSYSENEKHKALRNEAVNFFAKHSKSPDFDALIPYLAMTYFDRFISRYEIPNIIESSEENKAQSSEENKAQSSQANRAQSSEANRVQSSEANKTLFLMCCLAIAWKHRTNKFDLPKFLKKKPFSFEAKAVRKMELYICGRLDWRMRTLSPIFFAEYFIPLLRLSPELPSPRRSVHQLIVKSQADIEFSEYRPSVLAASAVLTVSSIMFNELGDLLRHRLLSSEFLNVHMDIISNCCVKLLPLYRALNPPPEDSSSSEYEPPTERSSSFSSDEREPLTEQQFEPGETSVAVRHWPGKEPAVGAVRHRPGKEPAVDAVRHRPGKESAVDAVRHRPGKEPAASEFELEQEEIGKDLVEAFDELMDFELAWTDGVDDDDEVIETWCPAATAAVLVEKLKGCSLSFVHKVNDVCTIL